MFRSPIIPVAVASGAAIIISILYLTRLRRNLSQVIKHEEYHGTITRSSAEGVLSIPSSAIKNQCLSISDSASKSISTSLLPSNDIDELITLYLRHTMQRFSHLPQSRIIRFMIPSPTRHTFEKSYISALHFKEGDVVCALFKIVLRKPGRVEFGMKSPGSAVEGRLVCTVEEVGREMVFSTRTVMWKEVGVKEIMPIERRLGFLVHELTSWWLLDSGTGYLVSLKEGEKGREKEKEM